MRRDGSTSGVRIRAVEESDVPEVFSMIVEPAAYERARGSVVGDVSLLDRALFGPRPACEGVIAEVGAPGTRRDVAGFALFFATFSTWLCLPGIWLEDLFVRPSHRRAGVGRALLAHLAAVVVERGYGRLEWAALRWNEPALSFYDALGAERMSEWETLRLTGDALRSLASASP
jgi:GNAT superfamily N-acetyltransferase